jgi:hypothetical protein
MFGNISLVKRQCKIDLHWRFSFREVLLYRMLQRDYSVFPKVLRKFL